MPASASSSCRPTPAGITISPIELMNGEHHFNEVAFDDVFVADAMAECSARSATAGIRSPPSWASNAVGRNGFCPPRHWCSPPSRALAGQDVDDRTAAELGDLMARMISLRQLSVSVARALSDGQDAASRAALVKDLGTRFEQDSVELVADLIDGVDPRSPNIQRLRGLLATARLHSPLFTLRGGTNEVLRGVVAKGMGAR